MKLLRSKAIYVAIAALTLIPAFGIPSASASPTWDVTLTYTIDDSTGEVSFSQVGAYASVINCSVPWTDIGTTVDVTGSEAHLQRYRISYTSKILAVGEQIDGTLTETQFQCLTGVLEPAVAAPEILSPPTSAMADGVTASASCSQTAASLELLAPAALSGGYQFYPGLSQVCWSMGSAGLTTLGKVPHTGRAYGYLYDSAGIYSSARLAAQIGGVSWPGTIDDCNYFIPINRAWNLGVHSFKIETEPICLVTSSAKVTPSGHYWIEIKRA